MVMMTLHDDDCAPSLTQVTERMVLRPWLDLISLLMELAVGFRTWLLGRD